MTGSSLRPLHVVQVGYDDSVFSEGATSDSLRRQLDYGRELARQRPNSRMSVVALTARRSLRRFESENVCFVPAGVSRHNDLIQLFRQLVRLHREMPVDVIATQTIHEDAWIALLFGRFCRARVIGQVHYDFFSPLGRRDVLGAGLAGQLRLRLTMALARHLHAIRVVSQRVKENLLARGVNRNVHVVPVPVTMAPNSNVALAGDGKARRVLFVGRLVQAKNLEDWLQVAQAVARQDSQVEFEIVGDGPLSGVLEAQAERMGIANRVHFVGPVSYDRLSSRYCTASVFLLTSHYEGFGRVLVESYLHSLPVVAPRISGVEDIVEDGVTGFLHTGGDLEGMAASVSRLLNDSTLRDQMGQAGCGLVRARFDPRDLSRRWVSLLVSAGEDVKP